MLSQMLHPIPEYMRLRILAYQPWQERQSKIIGKHLLLMQIKHFDLDLTLSDLQYTPDNKPYFDAPFDFSIAHSAHIVLCGATIDYSIGIDIEQLSPIEIDHYQDHLTLNEWDIVTKSSDKQKTFYDIWTKKEAMLKATGRGIHIDLNKLDVSGDSAIFESISYSFHPVSIAQGYVAHLATPIPLDQSSLSIECLELFI